MHLGPAFVQIEPEGAARGGRSRFGNAIRPSCLPGSRPGHGGSGPGNVAGSGTNLFAYPFDPSGNRNEFSGDMNEFGDDTEPGVLDGTGSLAEIMNIWASNMPESFMTIGS